MTRSREIWMMGPRNEGAGGGFVGEREVRWDNEDEEQHSALSQRDPGLSAFA